jgi:cellulose synthase/poly-beta-1,6-N-acetylglucosamine synthase-like glycosyltransferase
MNERIRVPQLVSIVIPARNASGSLARQLTALSNQTYEGAMEIIVADNGCNDGTAELARSWPGELAVRVVSARARRGPSFARNRGATFAKGDLLLFSDADDCVSDGWVEAMVAEARTADVVGGRYQTLRVGISRQASAYISPPSPRLRIGHGFLPFADGSCFGIWADVLHELGGWDERFLCGQDLELSWRAQISGYSLGYAPDAVVEYSGRSNLIGYARQQFRWGYFQPLLFKDYRDAGMRRTRLSMVWRRLLIDMLPAILDANKRIRWIGRVALHIGRLLGSLRYRVLYA